MYENNLFPGQLVSSSEARPRGYKTFSMLNSINKKTKIPPNLEASYFKSLRCCIYHEGLDGGGGSVIHYSFKI